MSSIKDRLKNGKATKGVYRVVSKIYNYKYRFYEDEKFAKEIYKKKMGKNLNLENPKTLDEKLWWLKFNYRNPLMTMCVDKYWAREYVKSCGYEDILNELYGVYEKVDDINFNKFKGKRVFLKCNHRSGSNAIYDDSKPFDKKKFKKNFSAALNSNYYYLYREWPYKNVKPLIVCEKVLETDEKSGLVDYRFVCFHGKVKYVLVDIDTCAEDGTHADDSTSNVYDREFNLKKGYIFNMENFDEKLVRKPKNYDKMLEIAEKLSKPFPYVRVDLYNIKGKIIFGEMTFFNRAGMNPNIQPKLFADDLANSIDLKKIVVKK